MVDPSQIAVSPRYTLEKLKDGCSLCDKIDVFEDQNKGWIFSHAAALSDPSYPGHAHSGLAVLILTNTHFEMIGAFVTGEDSKTKSKQTFKRGFREVFPDLAEMARQHDPETPAAVEEAVLDVFYDQIRNGLFHEAMIKGKVIIRAQPNVALRLTMGAGHEVAAISIDPGEFLKRVVAHFDKYVAQLRAGEQAELVQNFEKFWDHRTQRPGATVVEDCPRVQLPAPFSPPALALREE